MNELNPFGHICNGLCAALILSSSGTQRVTATVEVKACRCDAGRRS